MMISTFKQQMPTNYSLAFKTRNLITTSLIPLIKDIYSTRDPVPYMQSQQHLYLVYTYASLPPL